MMLIRQLPGLALCYLLWGLVALVLMTPSLSATTPPSQPKPRGELSLEEIPALRLALDGVVGQRVQANIDNWLMVAPDNNPGLLGIFAQRDSGKMPDMVPWAGEFVGKYLISSVQAMRMSDDPKLRELLQGIVDRLVALQAEDGYLGPWTREERLLGHWDLWGHYHVMFGLMMWYEHTGDSQAMTACRRAADLVCDTYLETGRKMHYAGSPDRNMAIIHILARLYRKTGEPRYLSMANKILEDFPQGGDYFRTGLVGMEFFRTPRPRWESLHCVEGLMELYRVTGDPWIRQAFLHHWASMRRFDVRNSGGFSSQEQASGNPYTDTSIETCSVIGWQAVMCDALQLTGDSTIADDLELTTFNAAIGAQHPSGAWCTYTTPMQGQRVPFVSMHGQQTRPSAPDLTCCTVNAPRGYGIISEWGLMQGVDRLAINYYGPMQADFQLADGTPITIRQNTNYPVGGDVTLAVDTPADRTITIDLRIPGWSTDTKVQLNGQAVPDVQPGKYLRLTRRWQADDEITLHFDMRLRYEAGDLNQYGKASLYRGPILLACDSRFQEDERFEPNAIESVDIAKLNESTLVKVDEEIVKAAGEYPPWLVVDVPTTTGRKLRMIDFANAGAATRQGSPISRYATWLPATGMRPPRPVTWKPADDTKVGRGAIHFVSRPAAKAMFQSVKRTVLISDSPTFDRVVLRYGDKPAKEVTLPPAEASKLKPHTDYYWKLVAANEYGQASSIAPYKHFQIDPEAEPAPATVDGRRSSDQMLTAARLSGHVEPEYGVLLDAAGWQATAGPDQQPRGAVRLDGTGGLLRYKIDRFPQLEYTLSMWLAINRLPDTRFGLAFSLWNPMPEDSLRLIVEEGKLFARIEAAFTGPWTKRYTTEGVPVEPGAWYHVVVVKNSTLFTLYVDGRVYSEIKVPWYMPSRTREFTLGGNPFSRRESEFLAADFADLRLLARVLSAEDVRELYDAGRAGR